MRENPPARIADLVTIGASGIRVDEVLTRLAENYQAHDWPAVIPSYVFVTGDEQESSEVAADFLLYQLDHMDMAVPAAVKPSRLPLLGRLLDALKQPLHQLVAYYVNIAIAKTLATHTIERRLIFQLRADLKRMESRLADLEARCRQSDDAEAESLPPSPSGRGAGGEG